MSIMRTLNTIKSLMDFNSVFVRRKTVYVAKVVIAVSKLRCAYVCNFNSSFTVVSIVTAINVLLIFNGS